MTDFVDYAGTKVKRPCRIHPNILAVMNVHNLRRDESMDLCADALAWLSSADIPPLSAIITSLPDADEVAETMDYDEWRGWFSLAASRCLLAAEPSMPIVFLQTDRLHGGRTESKAKMIGFAADYVGMHLLWHKIVLRRQPGQTDLHRPTYSHLVAYSIGARPGSRTPDVLAPSPSLYKNGMPWAAARTAVDYAVGQGAECVIDPFCGYGTVLAAADEVGVESIGVDIDPQMALRAREVSRQSILALT